MKLSEIKQVLEERGIRLTRSLGQNFLHDGNQLNRIVEAAELSETDRVLEIGPGLGVLTERLLARAAEVCAIEIDRRLVAFLTDRFSGESKLQVHHGDALSYLREQRRDWSGWKLVSNLPYSAASPILVELARATHSPERMVATVQSEVARRLSASAGTADYGVLSLLVQLRYAPQASLRIPASCFFPVPDVESACTTLLRRAEPYLNPEQESIFVRLVKRGFSQRRKMMFKLLKADWPENALRAAFEKLGLPSTVRAEAVSVDQFVAMAQELTPRINSGSWGT